MKYLGKEFSKQQIKLSDENLVSYSPNFFILLI